MHQPEVEALRRIQTLEAHIGQRLDAMSKGKVDRVIDFATKGMLILMPAAFAFIYAIDVRSQGNERELKEKVSRVELQQTINAFNEKIGAVSTGPVWLRADLSVISNKLDAMKDSMTQLSERVVRIEAARSK